jgi:hypothetical protein
MGCDFYILKVLRIYYNDDQYLEVEVNREKGYYDDYQFDEDSDDYEDLLNNYIEFVLTPKTEPIVIYKNGKFNKSSCELKYKTLVEAEIHKHGKQWNNIVRVIKIEERRER